MMEEPAGLSSVGAFLCALLPTAALKHGGVQLERGVVAWQAPPAPKVPQGHVAAQQVTCENRRAPALTESQNETRISAAPIALGERYEKGRRSLTASSTPNSRQNSTSTASPPNGVTARFVSPKIA